MASGLTVQSVIQYFENKLRRTDGSMSGSQAGEAPWYPMMVVYIDTGAADGGAILARDLTRLWPQYLHELHFLAVRPGADGPGYSRYILSEDGFETTPITPDGAAELAASLLGTSNHFSNYSHTILYFVVETAGLGSARDFDLCRDAVEQVINNMGIGRNNLLSMLLVLLNESSASSMAVSRQIRKRVSAIIAEDTFPGSVCLLSNRRYDNRVLTDRETYLKIASAVIAVSDNRDTTSVQDMFINHTAFTAGYAREEKPTSDICQFLVTELLDKLSALPAAGAVMSSEKSLPQRLGVTQNGTVRTLDEYARTRFGPLLPTPEQLELFPRTDCGEFYTAPESMSARQFDEQVMGAWSAYLSGIVNEAKADIDQNPMEARRLAEEYAAFLRRSFTAGELIWLADHPEKVDECFTAPKEPNRELGTLEYAREYLKYLLSSNRNLCSLLRQEIDRQCGEAGGYIAEWQKLRSSVSALHHIPQGEDFTSFYRTLFNNYYFKKENEINTAFRETSSGEGLKRFFQGAVDGMLHDDDMRRVICASFESELRQRLTSSLGTDNISSRVSYMLDPEQVQIHLQTNFSLGGSFRSFILMKRDPSAGSLYTALKIPAGVRVYNTGRSDAVEVLNLYALSPDSIM